MRRRRLDGLSYPASARPRLMHADLSPQLPVGSVVAVHRWVEVVDIGSSLPSSAAGEVRLFFNITNVGEPAGLELSSVALSMPMVRGRPAGVGWLR